MIALSVFLASAFAAAPSRREIEVVGPTVRWQPTVAVQAAPASAGPATWSFEQLLPIRTPEIQPGAARGRLRLAHPLSAPMCVLGADASSVQWLDTHAVSLAKANIACWVVNVEGMAAWSRLRRVAGKVELLPMSGGVLVEMGLRTTPVLIQRDGRLEGLGP